MIRHTGAVNRVRVGDYTKYSASYQAMNVHWVEKVEIVARTLADGDTSQACPIKYDNITKHRILLYIYMILSFSRKLSATDLYMSNQNAKCLQKIQK